MIKIFKNQKGQVVSIVTFFVLIIMVGMALTMGFLISLSQNNTTNDVKSTQSYYAAESGIEDALIRLKKTPTITTLDYNFNVGSANVVVNIPSSLGISKTINSQANNNGIERKVQAVCSLDNTSDASFYYGVEVGEGGLIMNNGSEVLGNVFSSGNISGSGIIRNDVVVSGNGHSINGVTVRGNASVYSCLSGANINGNLTYVTGGSHACTVGGTTTEQSEEILQQPLPIPQTQIDEWKNYAAAKEVFPGNKTISGNQSLGPVKITGNLVLNNNAVLTLTGVVYVQGRITLGNNVTIQLDSSFGTTGGVIISDGIIIMGNSNIFRGSGQTGSYVLVLSTSLSDSAITVSNNSDGAVFYASAGGLTISNNVSVTEATGYKVIMLNNSRIQYSNGIVHIYFSSGTGGGWKVTSWQEQ